LEVDNEKKVSSVTDCRKQFPSLTNLQIGPSPPPPPPPPPAEVQELIAQVHGNIVMMQREPPFSQSYFIQRTPTGALCGSDNPESDNGEILEFHFPLTTSIVQGPSNPSKLTEVYLLCKPVLGGSLDTLDMSGRAAVVTQVDMCDGPEIIQSYTELKLNEDYSNRIVKDKNLLTIIDPREIRFGLSLCAHVKLMGETHYIGFYGIGARFKSS
jgi:hypothetical protein